MPDADAILRHVVERFQGLDVLTTPDAHFVYFDPQRDTPHDRRQPFMTLVLTDGYDQVSNLSRPGVFRLSLGVSRETYRSLFGPEPGWNREGGPVATGHDFAALDAITPQPFYAPLSWISVLSPGEATWERVKPWIDEAYGLAVKRYHRARGSGGADP